MKKKTLMQSVLPLLAIAVTALCISFSALFVKANAEPVFSIDSSVYASVLPRNSVLTYSEENKATLNGTDYELSVLTTYPSGKTNTSENVVLNELGDYTVKYFFNDGNHEYSIEDTFSVDNTVESLFSSSEMCEITGNVKVPDYMLNADEGYSGYWGSEVGVKFKVNSEDAIIRYDGIIDMTKMSYEQEFIEMMVTPEVYDEAKGTGVLEFANTKMVIRLRDALNPEIGLEYVVNHYTGRHAWLAVRTIGGNYNHGYRFWYNKNKDGHCYLQSPFTGYTKDQARIYVTHTTQPTGGAYRHEAASSRFYYDMNRNASYALPLETNWVGDEAYEKDIESTLRAEGSWGQYVCRGWNFTADYERGGEGVWQWDDPRGDKFSGFPSGAATLEITFNGLGKGSGNLMIFSIGGQKLENWEADSYETKIYVDTGAEEGEELPNVIASPNSVYPVFDAIGYNAIEGVLATPSVKVYYNEIGNEIPVKNGTFPTKKSGKYYIEYTVYPNEKYGVATSKTIVVEAKDLYDFNINYSVNPMIKTSALVGDKINLYEGIFTMPESQKKFFNISTDVFYNGKVVSQYKGDLTNYFIADKTGEYYINYSYTDFGGAKSLIATCKVTVTEKEGPVISNLILPEALIKGAKYEFPIPTVSDDATISVKVGNTDYTAKEFTVPNEDFTVTYTATAGGKTTTETRTIKVLDSKRFEVKNGTKDVYPFLADYFDVPSEYKLQNYSVQALPFNTTTSNELISFVNAIDLRFFKVNFFLDANRNNYNAFNIVITDAVNPLQKVVLKFVPNGAKLDIYNNDVLLATADGRYNTNAEQFSLVMNDGLGGIYNGNEKLANIKEFANGYVFSGFESGMVFVDFGFEGVSGTSTINISNIGGQAFNCSLDRDRGDPNVYFNNELPNYKIMEITDSIVIELPKAYDVISAIKEIKAIITLPSKQEIIVDESQDGLVFNFADYGYGEYIVEFEVTDYAGRTNDSVFKKLVVKDLSEPTIVLEDDIAPYVSVGEVIELPKASAYDIVGSNINVHIYCTYNLNYVKLGANNTLTFDKAGTYKIYYFAVGENGNSSLMEIVVEAK